SSAAIVNVMVFLRMTDTSREEFSALWRDSHGDTIDGCLIAPRFLLAVQPQENAWVDSPGRSALLFW
ncbi:MAG: hypothetical protein ACM3NO_02300, partial [Deltaproteobacteria bacterium]